jgi:hypothetical protein
LIKASGRVRAEAARSAGGGALARHSGRRIWRRRRAEIAAIRRKVGELVVLRLELQRQYGEFIEWVLEERRRRDPRLRSHVIKYNADQPRVPGGEHGGGQWTSGGSGSAVDTGGAPATSAPSGSQRGPQYAQADSGTRADATADGGNASAAAAQQYPKDFVHDLANVIATILGREHKPINSSEIPTDSPKHPESFVDSSGQPILDDKGNQILRPADLPPEVYVQAGLAAKSRNLADTMHQLAEFLRGHSDLLPDQDTRMADMTAIVTYELLAFAHAGSLDAERFDNYYIRDYRHYTSIALGVFMAAAGVSREDMLTIADYYASSSSHFHEEMDDLYPHSTKQDIQDNLRGYDLYESGRSRFTN